MIVNVNQVLKTITGAPFTFPGAADESPKPVVLGDMLLESALVTPMERGTPVVLSPKEIVKRNKLAQKIYDAMTENAELTLTTEEVVLLRDNLPLVTSQRGLAAQLIGAALIALCPDDFN